MRPGDVTVVEGPDGAGKTVLARALAAMWAAEYVHLGPHAGDPRAELLGHVRGVAGRHPEDPVVFDRFHLGEQVYGPIYRGRDGLGFGGRLAVEAALAGRRAVVVVALPPYGLCRDNWARRKAEGGEMFPDPEKHAAVWHAFASVKTALPVVWYDYTSWEWSGPAGFSTLIEARRELYYGRRA